MSETHVSRQWTLTRGDDPAASMSCDLVSTSGGLEARCSCGNEIVRAQRAASIADAMNLCAAWKAAFHSQGWIEQS